MADMVRRTPTTPPPADLEERILDVDVTEEMRGSFLEYAYSVIYSRAIPDARDGLKPVQRRILFQMNEMGLRPDRAHVKCGRVVGDVMGRLHPHGDGAIYACVALALVMIYVSTDHINFAQGEMAMFSTYISWQLMSWGVSFWFAFILAVVLSFVLGVIIERVILRPLHNAPVLSIVVVFIGLLAIFNSVAGAIWSYLIKEYPTPFPKSSFGIAGVIGPHQLGVVLVTLIVLGLLFAFFRYTPLGLAMRAAAQNPQMARLVGVRVDWMLALGWGLAAAVGAVAGIMVAHIVYLDPNMMGGILLYAFAGALVGGIGNPGGAVLGGFIVGVLENMVAFAGNQIEKTTGIYIVGNGEKLTVALIIVIFVITVRPAGIFGRVVVKRV